MLSYLFSIYFFFIRFFFGGNSFIKGKDFFVLSPSRYYCWWFDSASPSSFDQHRLLGTFPFPSFFLFKWSQHWATQCVRKCVPVSVFAEKRWNTSENKKVEREWYSSAFIRTCALCTDYRYYYFYFRSFLHVVLFSLLLLFVRWLILFSFCDRVRTRVRKIAFVLTH